MHELGAWAVAFSLSSLVFIATAQLALMLLISTIFFLLYNKKLSQRTRTLTQRLANSEQEHAKKMAALKNQLQKKADAEQSKPSPEPEPALEIPGGEASTFLNRWIEQCEQRLESLDAEIATQFEVDDSAEIMAARMRIAFLEGEKLVLPLSNDSEMLWETIQPNIDRIALSIRRHAAALSGSTQISKPSHSASSDEKAALEKRLNEAQALAHETVESLLAPYQSLQSLIEEHNIGTQAHTLTDTLANQIIALTNVITQSEVPHKHFEPSPFAHEAPIEPASIPTLDNNIPEASLDSAVDDILAQSQQTSPSDLEDSLFEEGVSEIDAEDAENIDTDTLIAEALAEIDTDQTKEPPTATPDPIDESLDSFFENSDNDVPSVEDMLDDSLQEVAQELSHSSPETQQSDSASDPEDPLDSLTFEDLLDNADLDLHDEEDQKNTGT